MPLYNQRRIGNHVKFVSCRATVIIANVLFRQSTVSKEMGRKIELMKARIPAFVWIDNASRKSRMSNIAYLPASYPLFEVDEYCHTIILNFHLRSIAKFGKSFLLVLNINRKKYQNMQTSQLDYSRNSNHHEPNSLTRQTKFAISLTSLSPYAL